MVIEFRKLLTEAKNFAVKHEMKESTDIQINHTPMLREESFVIKVGQ